MSRILLTYSTTDGHTLEICQRIKEVVEQSGQQVQLTPIVEAMDLQIQDYSKVIIGASIRYGKHKPEVTEFINKHQRVLEGMPNALFSVNAVARKPEKNSPDTNPYLQKFLRRISWQPKELEVFAGKINYPIYGFLDRQMIRLIMWMTDGPTKPTDVVDFTDWEQVDRFAQRVSGM